MVGERGILVLLFRLADVEEVEVSCSAIFWMWCDGFVVVVGCKVVMESANQYGSFSREACV